MNWPSTQPSLLVRIRDRADQDAWRQFVKFYAPVIQSYCVGKGLSHADAEDVTQDALLIVSRVVPRFRYEPQKGRFRSWLATIINHEIYRRWEKAGRVPIEESDRTGSLISADAGWSEHLSQAVVRAALEIVRHEHPPDQWQVFEQLWYEKETVASLAKRLGRRRSWIYKTKSVLLHRFKEVVQELTDDTPMS